MRIILGGVSVIPIRLNSAENQFRNQEVSSLDGGNSWMNELKGARVKGNLSVYKLRRARTMVFDVIHSALG